eukprot:TRINITY_DN41520_c0_g1_i1.p1 TRINITY_DN41520_c0_g1~~TRINITY_DN41520_c0_g1_i1.p1  ORF type:complete len:332 (-),score=46.48 TRINITY_DN41520_c0_g1_i1:133-1128(-)
MDLEEVEALEDRPLLAGKGAKDTLSTRVAHGAKKHESHGIPAQEFTRRMALYIPGPVLVFVLCQILFIRSYHFHPNVVLILASCIFLYSFAMSIAWSRYPWQPWVGRMFCIATIIGTFAGWRTYYQKTVLYYHYRDASAYLNAAGSQPAPVYYDAGTLAFSSDTFVDVSKSVGYMSAVEGVIVCVAPVIDSSMPPDSAINFYAFGLNCCGFRGSFHCGDAANVEAKAALVAVDVAAMTSPLLASWFAAPPSGASLQAAVNMQKAVYGGKPGHHLFIDWVKDPVAKMNSFLDHAIFESIEVTFHFIIFQSFISILVIVGMKNVLETLRSFVR